ncbi:MAG: hypothetical protein GY847_30785 [Proteobacteria bacterium]|nr:hypothetical protein [Pseudomonadota bacterium]
MIECPNCGTQQPDGTTFCDACGADTRSSSSTQLVPPLMPVAPPPGETLKCPACNVDRVPNEAFCNNCGAAFDSITPPPVSIAPPPRTKECPQCGTRCSIILAFCDMCGASFNFAISLSNATPSPTRVDDDSLFTMHPLVQFVTTYTLGDDNYDPSFSIELENGEFMGECGMGISESIVSVDTPTKVTAFEIWLFDKDDLTTPTKVYMSKWAFDNESLRTKLAPKGELVLCETDKVLVLESKNMYIRARPIVVAYGIDNNLPLDIFFDKLQVELSVWIKQEERVVDISALPDDLLYIQYLAKEFLTHTERRAKVQEQIADGGRGRVVLSAYANLRLSLFSIEQAIGEGDLEGAARSIEDLTGRLQYTLEARIKQKATEIGERLEMIEERFPPETAVRFREELEGIVSQPVPNLMGSIETLARISDQIRQSFRPRQAIVCKVNVFAHGHRDVFGIESQDKLEDLASRVKKRYADDIGLYLHRMHKERIPLSEVRLVFLSDAVGGADVDSVLDMGALLVDIPQRETEGVTWYPEWVKGDVGVYTGDMKRQSVEEISEIIPSEIYEIPIEALDLSERTSIPMKHCGITSIGEVVEMLTLGEDTLLTIREFEIEQLYELKTRLQEKGFLARESDLEEPDSSNRELGTTISDIIPD